ncbi:MAG: DNA mismatch repair endonuclease MutL [Candidatus Marinimicrobia bacterium]|nr:DNA mismatch repair endonuclease MutL [Candidatus Neomarinimicrobiota bacterium]
MSKIRILSERLTNKIAAGEVVQRPASIVKELVENSIDADSTEITVVIKNGGKSLCYVIDNGEGMSKDDLLLAFERYATSKISTVNDLLDIRTLGFRGEALASVSAVSIVDAISTLQGADTGYELRIDGGKFCDIKPHSPKPGTSISVRNLFYNVPARRKFLKSKEVEFRNIVEIMRKFAMIHPCIRFTLIHDEKEIFRLRTEKAKERIEHLFSSEYGKNLLPIESKSDMLSVSGFIGNLNLIRARRGEQYFYVNNRFVTDRYMNHAIISGYSGLLSRGEFPFYCIHLIIPPEMVDVNVHPTKMEVKFQNESMVYQFLKSSVEESLKEVTRVIPDLEKFSPSSYYSPPPIPGKKGRIDTKRATAPTTDFEKSVRKEGVPPHSEIPMHFSRKVDQRKWSERAERFLEQGKFPSDYTFQVDVPLYQFHNKYIISQVKSGLVIIDQHVAHERILYEEAMESMEKEEWKAQQLLFPQIVELSVTDFSTLLEILPFLEKMGFRIKEFGKNTIAIEAVPAGMKWGNEGTIIKEILDNYQDFGTKETNVQSKVAASFSCKAAIKSGDSLTEEEMRNLVDRLFATKNPYFCPHGRPIIINLTMKELDKRFERA